MSKGQGWHGDSHGHSLAARGISVREAGRRAEAGFEHQEKEIETLVHKNWERLMNAEEDEVVMIGGYNFEIIDKDSEVRPAWNQTVLIDDVFRTWFIEWAPGKTPQIHSTGLMNKVAKKARKLGAQRDEVVKKYGQSATITGRLLGRSAKAVGKSAKRVRKKVKAVRAK